MSNTEAKEIARPDRPLRINHVVVEAPLLVEGFECCTQLLQKGEPNFRERVLKKRRIKNGWKVRLDFCA